MDPSPRQIKTCLLKGQTMIFITKLSAGRFATHLLVPQTPQSSNLVRGMADDHRNREQRNVFAAVRTGNRRYEPPHAHLESALYSSYQGIIPAVILVS